jgi:hypothetical protein
LSHRVPLRGVEQTDWGLSLFEKRQINVQNEVVNKKLIPLIIILVVSAFGLIWFYFIKSPKVEKFIVASPFSVSQIAEISKFRSCVGHNYSGYNENMELEEDRSMKHYLIPQSQFINSNSSISVFSPFDGLITEVEEEEDREGYQVWISPRSSQSYHFVFFHIILKEGLVKNSEVTAGQHIGFAQLEDEESFDIALKKFVPDDDDYQIIESPFPHMSSDVFYDYESKGLNLYDLIITKEDRDKIPCTFGAGSNQEEWVSIE